MTRFLSSPYAIFAVLLLGLGAYWQTSGNSAARAIADQGIPDVVEMRGTLHANSANKTLRDASSNLVLVTEDGVKHSFWCSRPAEGGKCLESVATLPSETDVVTVGLADYQKFGLKNLVVVELTLPSGKKIMTRENTLWKATFALKRSPAWAYMFSCIFFIVALAKLNKTSKKATAA